MSQTAYNFDMAKGYAGMKADSRFDHVESMQALENIPIGRGLVKVVRSDTQVRLPRKNVATIVFDADFVTGNNIDLKINGVAITTVPFNTSHAQTVDDLVTEIENNADVYDADDPASDPNNRTIVVTAVEGKDMIVTDVAVTGGASQAGSVTTLTSTDSFYGVALQSHDVEQQRVTGVVQIDQYKAVNTLRQGACFVNVEEAVSSDDSVYMRLYGDGMTTFTGNFRKSADGNNTVAVTGARFKTSTSGAGVAVIEFVLP